MTFSSISFVVENCLVLSLSAESYIMKMIAHDLLEYAILEYTAPSGNPEKFIKYCKHSLKCKFTEEFNNSL